MVHHTLLLQFTFQDVNLTNEDEEQENYPNNNCIPTYLKVEAPSIVDTSSSTMSYLTQAKNPIFNFDQQLRYVHNDIKMT